MTDGHYVVEIRDWHSDSGGVTTMAGEGESAPLWLSVSWRCCHVRSRIYRNAERTAYVGRCPRCRRTTRARIRPDGVASRYIVADA